MLRPRIATLIVFLCTTSQAAGLFVPDIGARGLARAGAMVASGDDLSALWYNPANLAAGSGFRTQLDLTLVTRQIYFQRALDPQVAPQGFDSVDNGEGSPVPVPGVWLSNDWGVKGLATAFGFYAPYNSGIRMPEDGPQRYTVIRSGSFVLFFHLAAAYQLTPWLRIGGGLLANSVFFNQRMAVNLGLGGPEDPAWDAVIDVYGTQHFLFNGNVGAWVDAGRGFEIGVSFLPSRRARATGTVKATLPSALIDTMGNPLLHIKGDQAAFELDFPPLVRTGLAWRYQDVFTVEADLVFEGWSSLQRIKIQPQNITLELPPLLPETPVPDIQLERGWKDVFSFRLGAEALVYRPWGLRARLGYYWEPGAVPRQLLSVSSTDWDKHGIGVGAGVELNGWHIELGYSAALYPSKTVSDSTMHLTNPLVKDPTSTPVIANGDYQFGYHLITAGVSHQWR